MSTRELKDFLRAGAPALALPRLGGVARMRAMVGVAEHDAVAQGLGREAAEWLAHVRAGRIGK